MDKIPIELLRSNFIINYNYVWKEGEGKIKKLVEMPGVEPGSENKTIKTPTFIVSVWNSVLHSPADLAVQDLHLKLSRRLAQVDLAASSKVWRLLPSK